MSAIYLFLGREGGFFLSSSMVEKPGTFPLTAPSLYQPFQKYFLPPYPEISELNFIASLMRIQANGQNWKDIIISVLVRVTPSGNQLFDFLRAIDRDELWVRPGRVDCLGTIESYKLPVNILIFQHRQIFYIHSIAQIDKDPEITV